MLHVCIDARLYNAAGIGTFLKAALTSVVESSRYRLTLLCSEESRDSLTPFSTELTTFQSPIYSLREQLEYVRKIPRCDLFWSPHFNIPLLPILAKKRLVTVCDVFHLAHFATLSLPQKLYAQVTYNAAFCLSDSITTISHFSKQEILKFATYKPRKITVLSPGFDHFTPPSSSPPKQDYLLYVGNVKPHKNLLRLVQAYDKLRPAEPLYIVGKREGLITVDKALFEAVEKSPFLQQNVHFTGLVSDKRLQELYGAAKVFIFPSTYEGFGYPPVEAMAFGCPVLASTAASIPEVCRDAVEYVDPFSVDSIAAGLRRLLSDSIRREELIQKGRALFAEKRKKKNSIGDVIDACCRRP